MSTIYESVRDGRPVEALFIDVHGHFGPWPETVIPRSLDAGRAIAEMDRYGCDMVWMSASNPGYSDDLARKNDCVLGLSDRHPDRIIPYCTLSAHTPERNAAELRRCMARGRCIGVKMHVYRQPAYTMRSPLMQPILEILAEHRLVYLNHGFPNVEDLEWALAKYPGVAFLSGHFAPPMNDLAVRFPNMFDCTCAAMQFREVENEVRRLGRSDTMLVGSDFSLFQLGFGVGMVAYADLPEEDKRNILGLNALRLLRRTPWFGGLRLRKAVA